ncbi:MAG: glucosamine-6-phosphate isomerase [Lentisphaeria bacterium]
MRNLSKISKDWWDYTTLDRSILDAAARLTIEDLPKLQRKGFKINIFETLQEFYCAEALEYIKVWKQATAARPCGVCGPIGPTEQLPIVAQIVNDLDINLKHAHFWGMDEWVVDGKAAGLDFPLGFAKADMDLCFNRIKKELRMPKENLHFPSEKPEKYIQSYKDVKCVLMQGGQGETKHWAFNDPLRREGKYADNPPTPEEYRQLSTRVVELHPITLIQNARTSGGGTVQNVPSAAISVGPKETWSCDRVSIWHPGHHDNPFGQRLSTYMIANKIADSAVPISLLSDHEDVTFNFYRYGFGACDVEMH